MGVDPLLPSSPSIPPRERLTFTPVAPQPIWPTVIGVISIVFGSMAIIGGCLGAVSIFFIKPLGQAVARQQQPNPFAFMDDWMGWIIGISAGSMLVAGLLLVGGIGLLRRAAWARSVILAWITAKMIFVVVQVLVNYQVQQDQFAAMAETGSGVIGFQSMLAAFGVIGVAIGILWGWALPVFMLIWFSRGKIRDQVRGWSARDSSASLTA